MARGKHEATLWFHPHGRTASVGAALPRGPRREPPWSPLSSLGFPVKCDLQTSATPFLGYLGKEVNLHESPKKKVYLKTEDRAWRKTEVS